MGTFTTAMDLGIGVGSVLWGVTAQAFGFQSHAGGSPAFWGP